MDEITEIRRVDDERVDDDYYKGFIIETTEQKIKVFIDSHQQCCEEFDVYIVLNGERLDMHDIQYMLIGHDVTDVRWGRLHRVPVEALDTYEARIEVETSAGLVELVAWNEHNGYYPHSVIVSWKDKYEKQEI